MELILKEIKKSKSELVIIISGEELNFKLYSFLDFALIDLKDKYWCNYGCTALHWGLY